MSPDDEILIVTRVLDEYLTGDAVGEPWEAAQSAYADIATRIVAALNAAGYL